MNQLPLIIMMAVLVLCRFRMMKARKSLTTEQKASLVDISSRAWQYLIFAAVIFGGLALMGYESENIHNFA